MASPCTNLEINALTLNCSLLNHRLMVNMLSLDA